MLPGDNHHFYQHGVTIFLKKLMTMLNQLRKEEIVSLLEHQYIGHLGCHADGMTLVVPISYVYAEGKIYCHTREGLKVDMMHKNPDVCFQVEDIKSDEYWKSVICQCRYQEITDFEEKKIAVKHLLERNIPFFKSETVVLSDTWPFHDDDTEQLQGIFFQLSIKSASGMSEVFDRAEGEHVFK